MDESDREYIDNQDFEENVSVNGGVNGSYKRRVNFELTQSKIKAIDALKICNYKTPIYKLASLLEELFFESGSKEGHWTYISEKYPPKAINSALDYMSKQYGTDWKKIRNPAAYFTQIIRFRKKRKEFRATNDTD